MILENAMKKLLEKMNDYNFGSVTNVNWLGYFHITHWAILPKGPNL
jgi:hypothetical protein